MTLVMRRPDDWHVHFRDGAVLAHTVPPIAAVFGRVVAMPNLRPPVANADQAAAYEARLRDHAGQAPYFMPLPSLYLTDRTTVDDLSVFKLSGGVAAKLYPANATTNSDAGVTDMDGLNDKLRAMEELGLVLQVHGETTAADCDIFDRERRFIDDILGPLVSRFVGLRVVLEHVTTAHGVAFVKAAGPNVGATVTPHHLEVDRSAMFAGGLRPHLYCLPVPKTRADRDALLDAVLGGAERFFLGSDSAPHPRHNKESACCAAGVYCGHHTLSHYAEVFARHGALDRLEAFASERGADFYGLARNPSTITLEERPFEVPTTLPFGSDVVVPYRAGERLGWQVVAT
jgi:dihydroorotase